MQFYLLNSVTKWHLLANFFGHVPLLSVRSLISSRDHHMKYRNVVARCRREAEMTPGYDAELVSEMHEHADDNPTTVICPNRVSSYIAFTLFNPEYYDLLMKVMAKFWKEQTFYMNFGLSRGSVIMEMLKEMGKWEEMYRLIVPQWTRHFDHVICYQLAMDVLFESGQYRSVLDVWQKYELCASRAADLPYPPQLTTIVAAACYKIDTAESYDMGKRLLLAENDWRLKKRASEAGSPGMFSRAAPFIAHMAVKMGKYDEAYNLMSLQQNPHRYIAPLSVSTVILAKTGEPSSAMTMILDDESQRMNVRISIESISTIRDAIDESNIELLNSFNEFHSLLQSSGRILEKSIEEILFHVIYCDVLLTGLTKKPKKRRRWRRHSKESSSLVRKPNDASENAKTDSPATQ